MARTKDAIGHVDVDAPADGMKVLTILQAGDSAERKLVTRVEPQYSGTLPQTGPGLPL